MYTKELINVFSAEIKTHLFRLTVENVDVILNAMTLPTRHNNPITNIYSGTDNVVRDNRFKNGCAVAKNTETNTTGCIFVYTQHTYIDITDDAYHVYGDTVVFIQWY